MTNNTTLEAVALLPCPRCSGEAGTQYHQLEATWSVTCRACPIAMPYSGLTEAEAVSIWNTRSQAAITAYTRTNPIPSTEGLVEALEAAKSYVERKAEDAFDTREDTLLAIIEAALTALRTKEPTHGPE